jgi:hypothetical protein
MDTLSADYMFLIAIIIFLVMFFLLTYDILVGLFAQLMERYHYGRWKPKGR